MKLHNFLQGSYTLDTPNYSCERTINWYPDMSELGDAKESEPIMLSTISFMYKAINSFKFFIS